MRPQGRPSNGSTPRQLDADEQYDAVISLCQGGFGLAGGPGSPVDGDGEIFARMARAVRRRGDVVVSAFSAYFQVRYLEPGDTFDANRGVNHEIMTIKDPEGNDTQADGWTTCFTPRELRQMARATGLDVVDVFSVTPGRYQARAPNIDEPEFLLHARKPAG